MRLPRALSGGFVLRGKPVFTCCVYLFFPFLFLVAPVCCSGMVPSKMSQGLLTYTDESTLERAIPLGRFGTPEDLGAAAIYLSSRAGAWVTGQVIPVDGGSTAQPIPFFQ